MSRAGVPRLDAAEAWDLAQSGDAVLVDVRPRALYTELHAAGAISMPLDELVDCHGQLPPDVTLVFYCA
jgi:rhodanese-related sulfurtransferase